MKLTRRTLLVAAGSTLITGVVAKVMLPHPPDTPALAPASGLAPSLPRNTVEAFLAAVKQWDTQALTQCGYGGQPFTMPEMPQGAKGPTLDCTDLREDIEGNTATLILSVQVHSEGDLPPQAKFLIFPRGAWNANPLQETLRLTRVGTEWKILASNEGNLGYLNYFATLSRYYAQASLKAKENSCLSNLKQVGLACMMFLDDNNHQFLFRTQSYEDAVWPYVQNEALFHCPCSDQPDVRSYLFNPALLGMYERDVPDPSRTVMLYEGSSEGLQFRHEGRGGVVFVDGQTRMVTAAEAQALIWTP